MKSQSKYYQLGNGIRLSFKICEIKTISVCYHSCFVLFYKNQHGSELALNNIYMQLNILYWIDNFDQLRQPVAFWGGINKLKSKRE